MAVLQGAFRQRRQHEPEQGQWQHQPAALLGAFGQQVQQCEPADRQQAERVEADRRPGMTPRQPHQGWAERQSQETHTE